MEKPMQKTSLNPSYEMQQNRKGFIQLPETIAEFGPLEPTCYRCQKAVKPGDGLVSFRWNSETNETIKSTVRVAHFDCDPDGHDPYRPIEEVFDFKGSGQLEHLMSQRKDT